MADDRLALIESQPAPLVALTLADEGARRLRDAFFAGRSPNTQRAYRQSCADFASYLSKRLARPLDEAEALGELLRAGAGASNLLALEFRDALRARPLSPGSVNRHLSFLRSAVELAKTLGMVPWSLKVPNLKTAGPYKDTRGPGRSAVRYMLDDLRKRPGPKAVRDRALLRLLYDLGLRRSEAAGLDLEHLDLTGARLAVLRKGKAERTWLSAPAPTLRALEAWLALRGAEAGPLFTGFRGGQGKRLAGGGVYRAVRKMGRNIGEKVRPHGVRHTAITEAVKRATAAGIGLDEVRQFSGHADVKTLMIYRDKERDVQGKLAAIVAASAGE
jgi:integrase/recombinase XerC